MDLIELTRRRFLQGSAATVATIGGGSRLFFGATDPGTLAVNHDTVIYLFMRGGMDGLNFVVPTAGNDRLFYEQARPSLQIATSGDFGALPLTLASGAQTGFGLHPSAVGLHGLWNAQRLAIVHACGLQAVVTRSHFDAQLYADLGTSQLGASSGWITRAIAGTTPVAGATLPSLAVASLAPNGFAGSTGTIAMSSPSDFAINAGSSRWRSQIQANLGGLWTGDGDLRAAGRQADGSMRTIAAQPFAARPASFPNTTLSNQLWTLAQSIKFELGLQYAALDYGGWDTHDGQGTAGTGFHYYQNKIAELSQALTAFHDELAASGHIGRVTVVIQSEFGRRVRSNGSGGTDHGYGNPMLVLGGPVNGRRFYGQWPGLDPEVLSTTFGDIPVTTDYRRLLSEILVRRMRNPAISQVFPGYAGYAPLGIMQGTDMAIRGGTTTFEATPVGTPVNGPTPPPAPTPTPAPVPQPGRRRMIGLQR